MPYIGPCCGTQYLITLFDIESVRNEVVSEGVDFRKFGNEEEHILSASIARELGWSAVKSGVRGFGKL